MDPINNTQNPAPVVPVQPIDQNPAASVAAPVDQAAVSNLPTEQSVVETPAEVSVDVPANTVVAPADAGATPAVTEQQAPAATPVEPMVNVDGGEQTPPSTTVPPMV